MMKAQKAKMKLISRMPVRAILPRLILPVTLQNVRFQGLP